MSIAVLPAPKSANAVLRSVVAGFGYVRPPSTRFDFSHENVSTLAAELRVYLPDESVSPPPLPSSHIMLSPCASSGPSGSAYGVTPGTLALISSASFLTSSQVFGASVMPACAKIALL